MMVFILYALCYNTELLLLKGDNLALPVLVQTVGHYPDRYPREASALYIYTKAVQSVCPISAN